MVATLPFAFRAPTLPDGSANALYLPYPNRNENTPDDQQQGVGLIGAGINDGGQIPPVYVSYAKAFALANFGYPPPPDQALRGRRRASRTEGPITASSSSSRMTRSTSSPEEPTARPTAPWAG